MKTVGLGLTTVREIVFGSSGSETRRTKYSGDESMLGRWLRESRDSTTE